MHLSWAYIWAGVGLCGIDATAQQYHKLCLARGAGEERARSTHSYTKLYEEMEQLDTNRELLIVVYSSI